MRYLENRRTLLHPYSELFPDPSYAMQVGNNSLPSNVIFIPDFFYLMPGFGFARNLGQTGGVELPWLGSGPP